MFDKILKEIQAKIGQLDYVMTLHADEEMEVDDLSILLNRPSLQGKS
jgi:hypothetical protein